MRSRTSWSVRRRRACESADVGRSRTAGSHGSAGTAGARAARFSGRRATSGLLHAGASRSTRARSRPPRAGGRSAIRRFEPGEITPCRGSCRPLPDARGDHPQPELDQRGDVRLGPGQDLEVVRLVLLGDRRPGGAPTARRASPPAPAAGPGRRPRRRRSAGSGRGSSAAPASRRPGAPSRGRR